MQHRACSAIMEEANFTRLIRLQSHVGPDYQSMRLSYRHDLVLRTTIRDGRLQAVAISENTGWIVVLPDLPTSSEHSSSRERDGEKIRVRARRDENASPVPQADRYFHTAFLAKRRVRHDQCRKSEIKLWLW